MVPFQVTCYFSGVYALKQLDGCWQIPGGTAKKADSSHLSWDFPTCIWVIGAWRGKCNIYFWDCGPTHAAAACFSFDGCTGKPVFVHFWVGVTQNASANSCCYVVNLVKLFHHVNEFFNLIL